MNTRNPKRFWRTATAAEVEGGYTVHLDNRPLRTPAKAPFVVPTRALAEAVAAEWDAQIDRVNPETMPVTRLVNSAIDKVSAQHAEVADLLAAYGETDLLCYRADTPARLVALQAEAWDPLLDWAEKSLGARLVSTQGVIPVAQDSAALARLRARTHAFDAFELAAFHDLVALSGSLVIGFATVLNHAPPQSLWDISRIDETWQERQWGVDDEASGLTSLKKQAFLDAARIFSLLGAT